MTYEEAMEPRTVITRAEARAEVAKHHIPWDLFLEEENLPDKAYYKSRDILAALGY